MLYKELIPTAMVGIWILGRWYTGWDYDWSETILAFFLDINQKLFMTKKSYTLPYQKMGVCMALLVI